LLIPSGPNALKVDIIFDSIFADEAWSMRIKTTSEPFLEKLIKVNSESPNAIFELHRVIYYDVKFINPKV